MRKKARKKPAKKGKRERILAKSKSASTRKRNSGGTSKKSKTVAKRRKKTSKIQRKAPPRKFFKLTAERYDEHYKAEELIGRENIKKGRRIIGSTDWLEPTQADFNKLKAVLNRVSKTKDFTEYSYSLVISFTSPAGKPVNVKDTGIGIPKFDRLKFQANNRKRKAAGHKPLTKDEFFRFRIFTKVRKKIFGKIAEVWGKYPTAKEKQKMSKKEAAQRLKDIQKRDAKFIFILNRENY